MATKTKAAKGGKTAKGGDVIVLTKDDFAGKKFKTAPAGKYRVRFDKKSKIKPGQNGNIMNLMVTVTGDAKGKKSEQKGINIFDNIAPHVGWKIAQVLRSIGMKKPPKKMTLKELLALLLKYGKDIRVIVGKKMYNGQPQNYVIQYLPLEESKDESDDDIEEEDDDESEDADGDEDGDEDEDDDEEDGDEDEDEDGDDDDDDDSDEEDEDDDDSDEEDDDEEEDDEEEDGDEDDDDDADEDEDDDEEEEDEDDEDEEDEPKSKSKSKSKSKVKEKAKPKSKAKAKPKAKKTAAKKTTKKGKK